MGCGRSTSNKAKRSESVPVQPATQLPSKILSPNAFADHYRLGPLVISLSYGEIRRCVHRASGLERTVKIVKLDSIPEEIASERYINREVKALSRLDHPNILKIFDMLFDTKRFYVIMEYWPGVPLLELLQSFSTITEGQVASIIEQLLSAICYAHRARVIHRDLHPGLVLIDGDSLLIKIAEFGSSAFIDVEHKFEGKFETSVYTAPEVQTGFYNEKCDIWSVGVIAHILLTGNPPSGDQINARSDLGTDFVQKLLTQDFACRPSAQDMLGHPWLKQFKEENSPSPVVLEHSLKNIKNFNQESSIKRAIRGFITNQVVASGDIKELHETFKALDTNGDGKICKSELFKYYSKQMEEQEARNYIEELMRKVDTDQSGKIEFSEFVNACYEQQKINNKKTLQAAFRVLDKDSSGKLSIEELETLFNDAPSLKNNNWKNMIRQADKNGDGQIDLSEFSELLLSNY